MGNYLARGLKPTALTALSGEWEAPQVPNPNDSTTARQHDSTKARGDEVTKARKHKYGAGGKIIHRQWRWTDFPVRSLGTSSLTPIDSFTHSFTPAFLSISTIFGVGVLYRAIARIALARSSSFSASALRSVFLSSSA